jgi:predicted transcriptional regulator
MINITTCDHIVISSLIKDKTKLSCSFQLFAAIDIVLLFRFFGEFEVKSVKYELLSVYSERVIERSLKTLIDFGIVTKSNNRYSVNNYEYHY